MKNGREKPEFHAPVLVNEVLEALKVKKLAHLNPQFIDATLGLGGHTCEIVKHNGFVLGIEADADTLRLAREKLKACPSPDFESGDAYKLSQGNFKDIDKITRAKNVKDVDGVLFDLGISSYQLSVKEKGFSFDAQNAQLDMRMDADNQQVWASDLLNALNLGQLEELFAVVMVKNESRKLSKKIVEERQTKPINKVGDFKKIIKNTLRTNKNLDVATLPFLALRIAVNSELENLNEALPKALGLLKKGGRLVVISFHSGEDRIVKKFFIAASKENLGKVLTKKPITPSKDEIEKNKRARSAKLRILEKL